MLRTALFVALYGYGFWLGFLMYAAVMNAGWRRLSLALRVLLVPPGTVFLVVDVTFNYTVAVLLFLQWPPPGCYTLSKRLAHNVLLDKGWRSKLSDAVVAHLLLPFTLNY